MASPFVAFSQNLKFTNHWGHKRVIKRIHCNAEQDRTRNKQGNPTFFSQDYLACSTLFWVAVFSFDYFCFWTTFDLYFSTCTTPVSKANFSASIAASVKAFVSDGQAKKPFVLQITLQSYDASQVHWPANVSLFSPNCLSNTMGQELFSKEFFCLYKEL